MSILSVSSIYYINNVNVKNEKLHDFTECVVNSFAGKRPMQMSQLIPSTLNICDNSIHAANFLQVKPLDFLKLNARIGTLYLYILLFNFFYEEAAHYTNYIIRSNLF